VIPLYRISQFNATIELRFPYFWKRGEKKMEYERFEALLNKFNVKAADVSRATGIHASTFSDWKKGKSKPKIDKIQKIADFFKIDTEYFLM